ncbi:MAG: hydroxylase, partial [Mycobacteriaceae bacterium]|nr:hydroxylase [Mycobacteriaceae bacterium]
LADHDELVDLVLAGGGLGQITDFFDQLQKTHDERMRELGLA